MISHMPPGLIMILAAFFLPFIPHISRQIFMLAAIMISAYGLFLGAGTHFVWNVLGFDLILYQADSLSLPFAIIFHLAAALNVIYSWHDREWQQHCAALSYAGAAIAALHAGDLVSLFVWWEATAVTSVFLIFSPSSFIFI